MDFVEQSVQHQRHSSSSPGIDLSPSPTCTPHFSGYDRVKFSDTNSDDSFLDNSHSYDFRKTPPPCLDDVEEYTINHHKTVSWADRSESPPSPQHRDSRSPGRYF